jgi:hypothetical protein
MEPVRFGGVSGIEELEPQTARIVRDSFLEKDSPQEFILWMERNDVVPTAWWDYGRSKNKHPGSVCVPFEYFNRLTEGYTAMLYLKMKTEMALKIVVLGRLPF